MPPTLLEIYKSDNLAASGAGRGPGATAGLRYNALAILLTTLMVLLVVLLAVAYLVTRPVLVALHLDGSISAAGVESFARVAWLVKLVMTCLVLSVLYRLIVPNSHRSYLCSLIGGLSGR